MFSNSILSVIEAYLFIIQGAINYVNVYRIISCMLQNVFNDEKFKYSQNIRTHRGFVFT